MAIRRSERLTRLLREEAQRVRPDREVEYWRAEASALTPCDGCRPDLHPLSA
jgi:hypothetical protein